MGDPWHKRYHSDALTGYRGLTLEQRGAYSTLLDLLYDGDDDALPASDRWLAGQLDVSPRKWRAIRDELIAAGKLIDRGDGRLTNSRFLREREKALALSEKRANAGRKGGQSSADDRQFSAFSTPENGVKTSRKHAENELSGKDNRDAPAENRNDINGTPQANASVLPPIRARVPDTRSQKLDNNTSDGDSTPRGNADDDGRKFDLFSLTSKIANAAGVSIIRPTAIAREVDIVKKWLADGLDVDGLILPVIAERLADMKPDDTVGSLSFFDALIRKRHALKAGKPRKAAPPPTPLKVKDSDDDRVQPFRDALKKSIGDSRYAGWVAPDKAAVVLNGSSVTIVAATTFTADWIRTHLSAQLEDEAMIIFDFDDVRITAQ